MKKKAPHVALLALLICGGLLFFYAKSSGGPAQQKLSSNEIVVNGHRLTVEIADDSSEQEQGLSDRATLAPDHGMLFVYDSAQRLRFWMNGMQFPLDMIFIRKGRVVHVASNVPITTAGLPTVVWPNEEADQVLELNAGESKVLGIVIGTEIHTD